MDLVTEFKLEQISLCSFRKYPYFPLLEIPIKIHIFLSPPPPTPGKFQSLLWGRGGYGYFVELHF